MLFCSLMGKQKKCSKSKKHRPKLVHGSFGKASVEDSFDSSRTRFRSAISSLKDVDFDLSDHFCSSSDEDDVTIAAVPADPLTMVTVSHSLVAESELFDAGLGSRASALGTPDEDFLVFKEHKVCLSTDGFPPSPKNQNLLGGNGLARDP